MPYLKFLLLTLAAQVLLAQTPTISTGGVLNHFSYALRGMPNSGIAQGSIFDIYGTNMGSTTLTQAGFPLPTTISGTSVQVTIAGATTDAFLFFAAQNQIVALLPSRTPTGTGTITVTRNGIRSATQPITVVTRSLGILTLAQNGQGPAVMQIPDASGNVPLNSATNPIRPGQIGVLYGTGLGAVPYADNNAAQLLNLDPPLRAFIADQPARILYQGRTPGLAGLDQINIEIPAGLSGCNLTLYFAQGSTISNLTTISVSPTSTCPDPIPTSPTTGTLRSAGVNLIRTNSLISGTEIISDVAAAAFTTIDLSKVPPSTASPLTQIGPCIVGPLVNTSSTGTNNSLTYLNGGPSLTLRGPGGTRTIDRFPTGFSSQLGITPQPGFPLPIPPPYLAPGQYTVDNGGGSLDVPGFTASITIPAPAFTWTNSSTTTIPRSQGFTITWSGGDLSSTGAVDIAGSSYASATVAALFSCRVPAAPGRFTIPAEVLSFLPASYTNSGVPMGNLTVSNTVTPTPLPLPGFTLPSLNAVTSTSRGVLYQ
jgi:uncharacterized protein (TIGR03437 family)